MVKNPSHSLATRELVLSLGFSVLPDQSCLHESVLLCPGIGVLVFRPLSFFPSHRPPLHPIYLSLLPSFLPFPSHLACPLLLSSPHTFVTLHPFTSSHPPFPPPPPLHLTCLTATEVKECTSPLMGHTSASPLSLARWRR